jgi:hypothetical protein
VCEHIKGACMMEMEEELRCRRSDPLPRNVAANLSAEKGESCTAEFACRPQPHIKQHPLSASISRHDILTDSAPIAHRCSEERKLLFFNSQMSCMMEKPYVRRLLLMRTKSGTTRINLDMQFPPRTDSAMVSCSALLVRHEHSPHKLLHRLHCPHSSSVYVAVTSRIAPNYWKTPE